MVITNKSIKVLLRSTLNSQIVIGGFLTFISPIFVILALKKLDLSVVYSFTALNYIFVLIGAKLFYQEKINLKNWAGIFLITLGLVVFSI